MSYHMTDNFRAWLAELNEAEVAEFAAKLDMPFLLTVTRGQDDNSRLNSGQLLVQTQSPA